MIHKSPASTLIVCTNKAIFKTQVMEYHDYVQCRKGTKLFQANILLIL